MLCLKVAFLLLFLHAVAAYVPGDRITASASSLHDGWKATTDMEPALLPRFGEESRVIFHTPMPQNPAKEGEPVKVNKDSDVKVQLAFGHALQLPWVTVYDSKKKVTLKKLHLTFSRDKYDMLRIAHVPEYSQKGERLEPSHPSTTAFEITYQWHGAEDQDNPHAIFVMFFAVVVAGVLMMILLGCSDGPGAAPSVSRRGSKRH